MNTGLAFGLLSGIPAGWRWVVGVLSLVALVVLLRVALRILPSGGWREQSAIGLIFGGAIGNLIDRTRFGAVVDFVDVYVRDWHWPASTSPTRRSRSASSPWRSWCCSSGRPLPPHQSRDGAHGRAGLGRRPARPLAQRATDRALARAAPGADSRRARPRRRQRPQGRASASRRRARRGRDAAAGRGDARARAGAAR